jgi:hypothetical protein
MPDPDTAIPVLTGDTTQAVPPPRILRVPITGRHPLMPP